MMKSHLGITIFRMKTFVNVQQKSRSSKKYSINLYILFWAIHDFMIYDYDKFTK